MVEVSGASVDYRLIVSAHDLAVALGIETDLATPVPQAAFEAREAVLADFLARGLRLSAQDERCTPETPLIDYERLPEDVVFRLRFTCPAPVTRLRIDYRLFFEIDPIHRSIGSVTAPDGTVEEFLFDRGLTSFEAALGTAPAPPWHEHFVRLLLLGVEHILLGFDHLLFLLALLIIGGGFVRLVGVVTAFTVSHSLTLALAWFGLVTLPERLVE
ncbi:MAG: HupE/UreJ family protein, partial [Kiloniellales bacterium]